MWRPAFIGLIAFCCLACHKGPHFRRTYPTEGSVSFQGKPAEGARIVLFPVEESEDVYRPMATVEADGSFKLSTYKTHDGAPVGKYQVSIVWPATKASDREEEDAGETPDRLGGRFRDSKTSGLEAEITASSANTLPPFQLK